MSLLDIERALGAVGLSGQPAPSQVAFIKQTQFQDSPAGYKDQAPPTVDTSTLPAQKALVDTTARRGVGGSIFFRRKSGTYVGAALGVVDFDLILDEETTYRAQVCQHPVQSGDPITDHIQVLPPTGRLKVLVSNYSLKYANGGAKAGEWDESQNRAMLAYETLKGLMRSRSEIALVTTLEDFSSINNYVVLTSLTTPKSADTGDALVFSIEYTQIFKVSRLKTSKLTVTARPADMKSVKNQQAAPEVSTGNQSPQTEDYTGAESLPDEAL